MTMAPQRLVVAIIYAICITISAAQVARFNWTAENYAVPVANLENKPFPYVDCDGTGYLGIGRSITANTCCRWECDTCWMLFIPYTCNCGTRCKSRSVSPSNPVAFNGFPNNTNYLTARGSDIYDPVGWTSWSVEIPQAVRGTEVYVSALFASTAYNVETEDTLIVEARTGTNSAWKPLIAFYGTGQIRGFCDACVFQRDANLNGDADSSGSRLSAAAQRFGTYLVLPSSGTSLAVRFRFSMSHETENFAFGGLRIDACKRPSGAANERVIFMSEAGVNCALGDTCEPGFFRSGTSGACSPCPDGRVSSAAEQSECTPCGAGQEPSPDRRECVLCAAHQYSTGGASCVPCPLGQQPNGTRTGCKACPLGTFGATSSSGDIVCTPCPEESYQVEPGTSNCANATVCGPGNYTVQNLTTTTDRRCATCAPGHVTEDVNLAECAACVPGSYALANGSACVPCDPTAEEFQNESAALGCRRATTCVPGTHVHLALTNSSDRTCATCAAGTFSAVNNAGQCEACAAGSVAPAGSSACQLCAAEEGPSTPERAQCQPCDVGTYSALQAGGGYACEPCAEGRFSNTSRALACLDCTACAPGFTPSACTATADRTCDDTSAPQIRVVSAYSPTAFVGSSGEVVEEVEAQRGGRYTAPTITALDPPLNLSVAVVSRPSSVAVDPGVVGETRVTLEATDTSGNMASVVVITRVQDTTQPEVTLLGEAVVVVDVNGNYSDAGVTVSDTLDAPAQLSQTSNVSQFTSRVERVPVEVTVEYQAQDRAGNVGSARRVLRVVDRVAPQLRLLGAATVRVPFGTEFREPGTEVVDAFDDREHLTESRSALPPGYMFVSQRLELRYEVWDRSGNRQEQVRVVEVMPNALPPVGQALELVLTGVREVEPRGLEQALRAAFGAAGRFAVVVLDGNATLGRVPFGVRNASTLGWFSAAHVLEALALTEAQLAALGTVRVEAMAPPTTGASSSRAGASSLAAVVGAMVTLALVALVVIIVVRRGRKQLSPAASVDERIQAGPTGARETFVNPLYAAGRKEEVLYEDVDNEPLGPTAATTPASVYDHPRVASRYKRGPEEGMYDEPLGAAEEGMYDEPLGAAEEGMYDEPAGPLEEGTYDEPLFVVAGNAATASPAVWRPLDCTRDEAEALLLGSAEDGEFLVRAKPGREDVALSLLWKGRVTHHLLARDAASRRWTVNGTAIMPLAGADDIHAVVMYLHAQQGHRMPCRLRRPVSAAYPVGIQDSAVPWPNDEDDRGGALGFDA